MYSDRETWPAKEVYETERWERIVLAILEAVDETLYEEYTSEELDEADFRPTLQDLIHLAREEYSRP